MVELQLLGFFLLALSATLFFGPQIIAYGNQGIRDLGASKEARFVAACLTTVLAFAIAAPSVGTAFGTGSGIVLAIAAETISLSFGLV